jgi:hypothetical protein
MEESHFHNLAEHFLYSMRIGATAGDILQEFIDIDVTSEDLVRILEHNPVYKDCLEAFVLGKSPAKKDQEDKDGKSVHRLISLLGMIGSRNFLLSLRVARGVHGQFPRDKENKIEITPSETIKLAINTEELCLRQKIDYPETAFAAAYHFDWMRAVLKKNSLEKPLETHFAEVWKDAIRTATVAYGLAERCKNFGPIKYAYAAGMLSKLGKITIAAETRESSGSDSWIGYQEHLSKMSFKSAYARYFLEEEKFKTGFAAHSALLIRFAGVFSEIERAIFYMHEPYYLRNADPNLYKLALVLNMAHRMGHDWKAPADAKDPMVERWKIPEMNKLGLTPNHLVEVMKWAMGATS